MQEENQETNVVDIKGTLVKLIKTDEPELNQEEAIMQYEEPKKKKVGSNNDDDAQNGGATEEQEHLKRVKQELLASLERVKQLEKKIYGKEEKENSKQELKVSKGGKHFAKENKDKQEKSIKKEEEQQER